MRFRHHPRLAFAPLRAALLTGVKAWGFFAVSVAVASAAPSPEAVPTFGVLVNLVGHCWQEQSGAGATICVDLNSSGRRVDVRFLGGGLVLEARIAPTEIAGWLSVELLAPGLPLRKADGLSVDRETGSVSWYPASSGLFSLNNACKSDYRFALRQSDEARFEFIRIVKDSCSVRSFESLEGTYVQVARP